MKKLMILVVLCGATLAGTARAEETMSRHNKMGMGIGLVAGSLAGPFGAILGAAGGVILGEKVAQAARMPELEQALQSSQGEVGMLRGDLADARMEIALAREQASQQLSPQLLAHSVAMDLYFRTGDSSLIASEQERLVQLSQLLAEQPGLCLELEGFADPRGNEDFNQALSQARVDSVRDLLLAAGIGEDRIHGTAYGETRSRAAPGDLDGHALERRVSVRFLSPGTELSAQSQVD